MWSAFEVPARRLADSKAISVLVLLAVSIAVRLVPELSAFPHPIGYDVVNYYIPVVSGFDEQWQNVYDEFPLYVILLHFVNVLTGLPAQVIVSGAATAVFGLFAFSISYICRAALKLSHWQSTFVALFAIIQLAVLRTAWDLHRDMFALSVMFLAIGVFSKKDRSKTILIAGIVAMLISVAADRMIGVLMITSLVGSWVFCKERRLAYLALFAGTLFFSLLILPDLTQVQTNSNPTASTRFPANVAPSSGYVILFAILVGPIIVPAILGFIKSRFISLKIPFVLTGFAALVGVAAPSIVQMLTERWIILFGIFSAIFAGYYVAIHLIRSKDWLKIAAPIMAASLFVGFSFMVAPNDKPLFFLALARNQIVTFMPMSMQFSALDIRDEDNLLAAINTINKHTENNAVIVGAKDWRGFMSVHLEGERTYKFGDNVQAIALAQTKAGKDVYVLTPTQDYQRFDIEKIEDSIRK